MIEYIFGSKSRNWNNSSENVIVISRPVATNEFTDCRQAINKDFVNCSFYWPFVRKCDSPSGSAKMHHASRA